jgi:uncharacterized protein (DUF433 family)
MAAQGLSQNYIVQDEGICGGQPRIAGTRLKVQHIALEYERLGWMPDQICDAHPEVTLAQVHAALAYYYAHKEEIDQVVRTDAEFAECLRKAQR